jgi:hypothetical protein
VNKRLYVMAPAEYDLFCRICNPPALLIVTAGNTPAWNKFMRAEEFWRAMGQIHGFDWESVEPCIDLHVGFFKATPLESQ